MSGITEYKCPCCGGAINFDTSAQKMKCPYCDAEFEVEEFKEYVKELSEETEQKITWESEAGSEWQESETAGMKVYTCESCGGEVVADENTVAAQCPYCDNNVIMQGGMSGVLKPDYVIPFKLDKKAAKEKYKKHLSNKRLLPKCFKTENHIEEIKGIYVPFWLYSADSKGKVRYKATRVRTWSSGSYRYTKTSFYSVTRGGDMSFTNIPVDGSSKMPDDLMESLEPYRFEDAVDFETAYLAGYLADKYDVDAEEGTARVNERIQKSMENEFKKTVNGYATVTTEHTAMELSNSSAKYALYPVWLLNTKWKDKTYVFAMNGQTGKFVGDLPVDILSAVKWFAGLFVGTGIVSYLLLSLFF